MEQPSQEQTNFMFRFIECFLSSFFFVLLIVPTFFSCYSDHKAPLNNSAAACYFLNFFCLNITYANILGSISPLAAIPSFPVTPLWAYFFWFRCLWQRITDIALAPIFSAGWFKDGHGLGLGNFVKEGKIGYIFARRRKRDYRRKLISPQNLIWKIRGANLASGRGWLNCSTHDHQEFKFCQLWVCPAPTWFNRIT